MSADEDIQVEPSGGKIDKVDGLQNDLIVDDFSSCGTLILRLITAGMRERVDGDTSAPMNMLLDGKMNVGPTKMTKNIDIECRSVALAGVRIPVIVKTAKWTLWV